MEGLLCITGFILLVVSLVLCWLKHDALVLWLGVLIIGEIITWLGALPVLLKLL